MLGTTSSCESGICAGHFAGAGGRRAQIVGAAEDQARDVWQRVGIDFRPARGLRPAGAGRHIAERERVGGCERRERAAADRPQRRPGFVQPFDRVGGRVPGKRGLVADRRVVQRHVEGLGRFLFAFAAALRAPDQPRQGGGVAVPGRADRRREFAAQDRVEVAGQQDLDQIVGGHAHGARAAVPVDRAAANAATGHPRDQACEVAHRFAGYPSAGGLSAKLAQDARNGRERRAIERIRPVRRDDRVEHERLDVRGIVLGVALGDLRPVGGPVQHELFVAAALAYRLDVGDRLRGRVQPARFADLTAAQRHRSRRAGLADVFEGRAGEGMREARPALVEGDQVARVDDRPKQLGELIKERNGRLSRSAGQRDHGVFGFAEGRPVASQRQRDHALRGSLRVQRNRQMPAGDVVGFRAHPPGDAGARRGGRQRGSQQGGRHDHARPCAGGSSHSRNLHDRCRLAWR